MISPSPPGAPARQVPDNGYHSFIWCSHKAHYSYARVTQHAVESFATPLFRARRLRLFRDDANLVMTSDLCTAISRPLLAAERLLVLLSPAAAGSV